MKRCDAWKRAADRRLADHEGAGENGASKQFLNTVDPITYRHSSDEPCAGPRIPLSPRASLLSHRLFEICAYVSR
jgi:hypothetical protein